MYVLETEWGRARDRGDLLCLGRERAKRLLPILPSGYGAVLMDFEGKTFRTSRQPAAAAVSPEGLDLRNRGVRKLVKNHHESAQINKRCTLTFLNMRDEGKSQKLGVLQQCPYRPAVFWALLFCAVPYRSHVINPFNLWVPNAWLKERKNPLWGLTPQVDFLASLGRRFSLQRLVRLLDRNGNQKTWAWLKEETREGWCNFRSSYELQEDKNAFWEVEDTFFSDGKELCFQKPWYEKDGNGRYVEITGSETRPVHSWNAAKWGII